MNLPPLTLAKVKVYLNVRVPMSDGVELATDIYLPNYDGAFPVVMLRSPYGTTTTRSSYFVEMAERGIAGIAQDCRGRFNSGGKFTPWVNEERDGQEMIEWLIKQPWCNGNIALEGKSYSGATQLGASLGGHHAIKCITPRVITNDSYDSPYYTGGALQLLLAVRWGLNMIDKSSYSTDDYDWDAILRHLPLIDTDEFAGPRLEFWKDMVKNPSYGKRWRKLSLNGRFEQIKAPALVIGGWFDLYAKQVFELFNGIRYQGGSETARTYTRIIVGPWGHGLDTPRIGELEFGYNAVIGVPDIIRKYIESFITLNGKPQDVETPVRIFVMGTNVWRDEYEWPLARTRWVNVYLSGGNANTANGNGELSFAPPTSNAPVERFVYDPAYPVPTRGGSILESKDCGPMDQREIESRPDVLVFTSEVLSEDLEVTGPVIMKLFASSSAMDTDFTAKLVDVYPDGRAMSVCDGIIRARYRDGFEKPKRLVPCKVYEFTIDLCVTSNVFLKGHHLRLEISSSNFPRFDRNPNTGHKFGIDAELRVAEQSIYHSKQYPSRLILPVIPR